MTRLNISSDLINRIIAFLNEYTLYAVLRNFEGLPDDNESRDIDIIILPEDFRKHQLSIVKLIADSGWKIVSYRNNGRLITFVCSLIHRNDVEIIQLDFFLHTSVHGITLIEAKEILKDREFNGSLYHVSKIYEFLDKYVYNRAVGEPYPKKYQSLRMEVGKHELVKRKLKEIFGFEDIDIIDNVSHKKLLKKALLRNLKTQFFKTVGLLAKSQWMYISGFLSSNVAVRIGFTGPDGAGKTTVIELLKAQTSSVFGKATENYHFRPLLIPNLGDAAHSRGLKKAVDKEYNRPHRSQKKGKLNSFFRLSYYTVDYIAGFWVKIKPHCHYTKFIIFDRYYTDIITDSRRSSIHLSPKFLYYWAKIFIPSLQYNILLTAKTDVILARKQELNADGINLINTNLKFLSEQKGYYLILNNDAPLEAVKKILMLVFEGQHLKNMKRIGKK